MTRILLTILLSIPFLAFSQQQETSSSDNPYYWKNRPPRPGYWQQDVHYTIKAEIDDSLNLIDAKLELIYTNNSPDTLRELYFHLYQNSFQPGSHMHSLYENNHKKVEFGENEKKGLCTIIENLAVDGQSVDTVHDFSILKITLNRPLLPQRNTIISIDFKTYFDNGDIRRRMKQFDSWGRKHFDGVHWYPSICMYDQKFGWTTEQHLDKEFYSDFGTWDVELTFPNDYIVDATGTLQNRQEVLPDSLREKLDIKHFAKRSDSISTIVPRIPDSTKTWKFHAENVHNFAFTADPTYRIGEVEWKGIKVVTLVREPNAHGWQQSGEFTKKVIQVYSEDFGMYAWPKIIIADAEDGMEYPMLTLDSHTFPGHKGLLAHEVGHMWFYGMVGSNETYRAMMDEGFTQFLTVWSLDKIDGEVNEYSPSTYYRKHLYPWCNRYGRLYYPYLKAVHQGYDFPLNTHSSGFRGAVRHGGGYGLVYYKTGVMLYNLRYVLGEELFQKTMKHYFDQWKMAHPYPEDFRQSIIEYTKVDLNWFFDQWIETTKSIDYAIKKVKREKDGYAITFERKGDMQMPIDFSVYTEDGDTLNYHIPNTWFEKETEATVLPKWYGWDNINPTHTVKIPISGKIQNIEIDPKHYLADVDIRDNKWKGVHSLELDHATKNLAYWYAPEDFIGPNLWYNGYDGIQAGITAQGNYFQETGFYKGTVWFNTKLGQYETPDALEDDYNRISVELWHKSQLRKLAPKTYFSQYFSYNTGLFKGYLELEKQFKPQDQRNPDLTSIYLNLGLRYRSDSSDAEYLLYPEYWSLGVFNNTLDVGIKRHIRRHWGIQDWRINLRTPGFFADVTGSYLEGELKHQKKWGKLDIRTRVYGRLGFGTPALESYLYLNGTNPEQMDNNKFMRARGFLARSWAEDGHVHYGGGLNLRGYSFFPSVVTTGNNLIGNSGLSANVEIDFNRFVSFKDQFLREHFELNTYLFGDVGTIYSIDSENEESLSPVKADAGIGSSLKIKWDRHLRWEPFTIRFDMPFFVLDDSLEKNFAWRYLIGFERSF